MEKEFALYPEAFELKQLGFDEPCFGRFDGRGKNKGKIWYEMPNTGQDSIPVGDVLAPTYSQAFRWFREKHDLVHHINRDGGWWLCSILDLYDEEEQGTIETHIDNCYPDTYEEAELACLCTLIKIVKNK